MFARCKPPVSNINQLFHLGLGATFLNYLIIRQLNSFGQHWISFYRLFEVRIWNKHLHSKVMSFVKFVCFVLGFFQMDILSLHILPDSWNTSQWPQNQKTGLDSKIIQFCTIYWSKVSDLSQPRNCDGQRDTSMTSVDNNKILNCFKHCLISSEKHFKRLTRDLTSDQIQNHCMRLT